MRYSCHECNTGKYITEYDLIEKDMDEDWIKYYIEKEYDKIDWSSVKEFEAYNGGVLSFNYTGMYDELQNFVRKFRLTFRIGNTLGCWGKFAFLDNNKSLFLYDKGNWELWEEDTEGRVIKYEDNSRNLHIIEYFKNGRKEYYFRNHVEKEVWWYDTNGDEIYYRDSMGKYRGCKNCAMKIIEGENT